MGYLNPMIASAKGQTVVSIDYTFINYANEERTLNHKAVWKDGKWFKYVKYSDQKSWGNPHKQQAKILEFVKMVQAELNKVN